MIWSREPVLRTTSTVAAAFWHPFRVHVEERVFRWAQTSFQSFAALVSDARWGVRMLDMLEVFREPTEAPAWMTAVPGFRRAQASELPDGFADGWVSSAPVVEMPRYLARLEQIVVAAGASLTIRDVTSVDEAFAVADVVVNCTGLGARKLFGDESVYPIRGHVVRVHNPGLARVVIDEHGPDGTTYVVPRSRDCVLGTTADVGEAELVIDHRTSERIIARCVRLVPALAGCRVLGDDVGLRPARFAVRLEREWLPGGMVVHDYGHGGAGVTLSWGCAEEVGALVDDRSST